MQLLDENGRDPQLWAVAKKRASFKNHLLTYLVVNLAFWAIWFFSGDSDKSGPIWMTFGWGIGLFFHFLGAYVRPINSAEQEYEKLRKP